MVRSLTALKTKGEVASSRVFSSLPKPMSPFSKSSRTGLLDLPDIEIDEAHGEHVVGEEGELVFAVV